MEKIANKNISTFQQQVKQEHKCEICEKVFKTKTVLKSHFRRVHDNDGKVHVCNKCETCGKSFSKASNLKTHIYTVHERHKDHKCESCGKSFSQFGHLKSHIREVHKGLKRPPKIRN